MTPLRPGDRLDHYVLEDEIASGGMAAVFRARDLRDGTTVAIKVPHPHVECDPALYSRFQREAEIGRSMDHPGVVRVLPAQKSNRVYFVMQWVEGKSLRVLLTEEKRLPVERAVRIAASVCEALDHIHANQVVHRDLKPENIILDARDEVTLIDFGIAGKSGSSRLTFGRFSEAMGTPDYVAPEQAKGKRGDHRTDIYGLGVILYEMVTGQMPFEGETPMIVLNSRLHHDPVPPRKYNPELSPEFEQVILSALERDPSHRYASASEFAADLQNPPTERPARTPVAPARRTMFFYSSLAGIPLLIFALLLYVAAHQ
jgi:serine/threonine-protein kinase